MTILIDTNILLAAAYSRDTNHVAAKNFLRENARQTRIVTASVLVELFYMTYTRMDYAKAIKVFDSTRSSFTIEYLNSDDLSRMSEIMTRYQSAQFDFVDCSILAVAERLNITRVATFDRRDFAIFRPTHCPPLWNCCRSAMALNQPSLDWN